MHPSDVEKAAKVFAEQDLDKPYFSLYDREKFAEHKALQYLAEFECPVDVVEWGKHHNIPTFAEVTWQAGFSKGWNLAIRWMKAQEDKNAN